MVHAEPLAVFLDRQTKSEISVFPSAFAYLDALILCVKEWMATRSWALGKAKHPENIVLSPIFI